MSKAETAILTPGWQRVRLGDVVENVNDFFVDRSGEAIRYVAGEHIDEGNLRVCRSGFTSDDLVPPTFNRLFKAGDVLFHSRNIRKLAQPDFDGLTGEKLFILRTRNQSQLSQALLPFLLQTEHFWNYVEERWAGSTNKFLNKTPLMAYEFALPPISRQSELVEALRAMETTLETQASAAEIGRATRAALVEDALAANFDAKAAKPLSTYLTDLSYGSSSRSAYEEVGYPILRIPNVLRGSVDYSDLQRIQLNETEYGRLALRVGDVLLVRTNGNPQYVGRSVVINHLHEKTVYASYLIRIRCDENALRPGFLAEYLNAPSTRQRFRGEVKSSAGNYNINISGIKKQPICTPTVADQDSLLLRLKDLDAAIEALESRVAASRSLKKHLLTKSWGA